MSAERSLHGYVVFVDEPCKTDALTRALHIHKCQRTDNVSNATLFIMDDPFADTAPHHRRVQWAASLMGAKICSPRVYVEGVHGPWLEFECALATPRFLWASPAFQDQHPQLWLLMLSVFGLKSWKLTITIEEFIALRIKWKKSQTKVIGLCTREESVLNEGHNDDERVKHLHSPPDMLKFLQRIDRRKSSLGLGRSV